MAEGGFGERDPLIDDRDDDDRNDDGRDDDDRDDNTTMPFQPNGASTPAPGNPMTTNLPAERGPETSFTLPDIPGGLASTTFTAEGQLYKEFPFAKKENLKYKINTKNGKLQVGVLKSKKRYYDLTTKKPGTDKYQINPNLTKEILKELGKSRRQTIGEKMKKLSDSIHDNKKIADDQEQSETERNKPKKEQKDK